MLFENKDYFDPDSEEELALAMSRTIEEVFDKKEGVFIQSSQFFRQSEGELVLWRRSLEESILIGKPRLVCSHCDQMVKLLGRRTERGKIAFFAHLHDSDECDIKTTSVPMSREEIQAIKYGKIQESERHMCLKNFIADMLSTSSSTKAGFNNVEVEKRVKSKLPYLNWRRPDVLVEFNGRKLVFELQLSTTFLDVVVDRDIFYRLNNYYIIWVFNFDDNQEFVNLENLMCKDIYYANKRNVFILDGDAQKKSVEEGKLYLKCKWIDENNRFTSGDLVAIDNLSFDEEQYKPYYIDADEIYYKLHPNSRRRINDLEHTRQEIIEGLMARMNKKYEEQLEWEKKQQKAIAVMKENGAQAEPFYQDGLYGYKYEDTILVQPYYKNATKIGSDGYGHVVKARRNGVVDRFGMSVLPCLYKDILPIGDGHFIVRLANQWKLFGREESIRKVSTCDVWYFNKINENLSVASLKYETKSWKGPDESKEVDLLIYQDGYCKFFKNITCNMNTNNMYDAHISAPFGFNGFCDYGKCEIDAKGITYLPQTNGFHIAINRTDSYGLADSNYLLILDFQYDLLTFAKNDLFIATNEQRLNGIITHDNITKIPFEYESICLDLFDDHFLLVEKEGLWGVINYSNEYVIPLKYDKLDSVSSSKWKVIQNTKCGIVGIDITIIPIIYDTIETVVNSTNNVVNLRCENKAYYESFWVTHKDNLYGLIDLDFRELLPCVYKQIVVLDESYVIVTLANNKRGVKQLYREEFLIEPLYDDIELRKDKNANNKSFWFTHKDNLYGLIDLDFRELLPCIYKRIDFLDERCVIVTSADNKKGVKKLYSEGFLIEPLYDDVELRKDNNFVCKIDERICLFSHSGKRIFSALGTDLSSIISDSYIFVWQFDEHNLYNISSGKLICKECYSDINVNEDKTIDLEKYTDAGSISLRIDSEGKEIPVQTIIGNTTYIASRFKSYTQISDSNGKIIIPYGEYIPKEEDGILKINYGYGYEKCSIMDITHGEIHKIADNLYLTSICHKYGVFTQDWRTPIIPYAFSKIEFFDNLFYVYKEQVKGVYSLKGELILHPIYSEIRLLTNGFFVCKLREKHYESTTYYGRWHNNWTTKTLLKDNNGLELLNKYENYEISGDYEDGKLCIRYKGEESYVDLNGNLILEDIVNIDNGYYIYKLFGKYGLKNNNKNIFEPIFDSILHLDDGNYIVKGERECKLYNSNFEVIANEPVIRRICENRYEIGNSYWITICDSNATEIKHCFHGNIKVFNNGFILITEEAYNKKSSYFTDNNMEPIFSLDDSWEVNGEFIEGKLEVKNNSGKAYLSEKFEILPYTEEKLFEQYKKFQIFGKWGVKRNNSIIHEAKYDDVEYIFSIGYILNGYKSSLYDHKGNPIIGENAGYCKIKYVQMAKPMFLVTSVNNTTGLCDINGTIIISPSYDTISLYEKNIKVMRKTDISKPWRRRHEIKLYGLFTPQGKSLLSCQFAKITSINENIFHGIGHNLNVYVKTDGEKILADNLICKEGEDILLERDGKWGLLDKYGNEIGPTIYKEIKFDNNKYIGRKGRIWYDVKEGNSLFIDKDGMTPLRDEMYSACENKKCGIVNSDGEELLPFVFDKISLSPDNKIIATIGEQSVDISILNHSSHYDINDVCIGKISNVIVYGLFIDVPNLSTGLLHKSKMSGSSPYNYSINDYVIVKILSIHEDGKIDYELFL